MSKIAEKKNKSLVSIVVPVYYNAEALPKLIARLNDVADKIPNYYFEFIFVDDGSGDDSFQILKNLAQDNPRVRVIKLSRNFGSNPTILAGLTYAKGACAVVIAADLQDPPELIPQLVALWNEDNPVVLAARRRRDDPFITRLFATTFNRLFRRYVFHDFPPDGFDFMLIDRCVVDILVALSEKNTYIFGQVMWVGFKRRVIYYDRAPRKHGYSRWTGAKKIKYLIDAFAAFSYLPLRVASLLGFSLAVLGFFYALLIIGLRLLGKVPITGWASLLVVVLIISGVQLILIGILGEYLWRTLDETRRRPPFIVESMVNFDSQPGKNTLLNFRRAK